MVFLRIGRFGQFCRSWLQPLTHPPHRRTGIVGDEFSCPALTGVGRLGVVVVLDEPLAAVRFFSSDQVRSSFSSMNFPLFSLRFMIMNSQWFTLRRSSKYSTDQWYLTRQYITSKAVGYGAHHFMRKTLVISPCVTSTHTLGKSSSPNCLHKLSLKPLTRSYASAALSPSGIR
jgi:hypothetical protein